MSYVNQMVEYMKSQQFDRVIIEDGQPIIFYRPDGSTITKNDVLELAQIHQLLAEIVPDQYQPSLASRAPLLFQHHYAEGEAGVGVVPTQTGLCVSITIKAPSTVVANTDPIIGTAEKTLLIGAAGEVQNAPAQPGSTPAPGPAPGPPAEAPTTTPFAADQPRQLRFNPDFPAETPGALKLSEQRQRLMCAIIGAGAGVLSSVMIFLVAKLFKLKTLEEVFNITQLTTVIPIAISALFFWGACICILRWRRLRALEQNSSKSLLLDATQFLTQTSPAELSKELEGEGPQSSPLLRRLRAVLHQWEIRPSLQDADIILQQHIASDEESVQSGYSLLRTFIWALPVLGLIGTVIGISFAVGGFATFLGGNIEDVKIVKENLVGVTGGLSFAFLITLHGLVTSLLIMFAASALQNREEKLYSSIEQDISDIFLPRLQQLAPARLVSEVGEMVNWRETLQKTADNILGVVGDECSRLAEVVEARQFILREQISEWSQALRKETEVGAARLGDAVSKVGTELANSSQDFLGRITLVRDTLDQQASRWQKSIEAQTDSVTDLHSQIVSAVAGQTLAVRETADVLSGLTEVTRSALDSQAALETALHKLGESNFEKLFGGFIEALTAQAGQIQAASTSVSALSAATEEAMKSQAVLQQAMAELQQTNLEQSRIAAEQQAASEATMAEQARTVQQTAAALVLFTQTTKAALESQASLQDALRRLGEANLEQAFVGLAGALSDQTRKVELSADAVKGLTLMTQEVLASQATLQIAINQLKDSTLEQTLASFRDSLSSLGPVLSSFREPFVLQAVPVASKAQGGD